MTRTWLLGIVGIIGCGTSSGGEPMHGDVTIMYGTFMPKLVVGSAIVDTTTPGNMLVQLGTDSVDCGTDLSAANFGGPSGTFVYFSVPATTPGSDPQTTVSVMKSSGNNLNVSLASASVMITSIDTRVMGSLVFATTSPSAGNITVNGSFDVKKCF